ncbi:MAG: hypothetical protein R3Y54_00925 [Eubacteriales bacterium]
MAVPVLAICDTDLEYLDRLYEAMIQTKNFIFDIRLYTNVDRITSEDMGSISILLMAEELHNEEFITVPKHRYVLLGKMEEECENYCTIRKYNKSEKIIQTLYEIYYESSNVKVVKNNSQTKLITFYSPIKRCYQTSFALTYGQILAKTSKVLFINLEGFSASSVLFQEQHPNQLTDFIYLLKNTPKKITYKLDGMIETINHLDIIPFCQSDLDVRTLVIEDIVQLIDIFISYKEYDYILLDLSDCIQRVYELLLQSDVIYTIMESDAVATAKITTYEATILHMEYDDVLEKTKKIKIPTFSHIPTNVEQLIYSELAGFAQKIVEEYQNEVL